MNIRNSVYQDMLSMCKLEDKHKENLLKRGLSEEAILRNGYKSIPSKLELKKITNKLLSKWVEKLTDVPGFFYETQSGQVHGVTSLHYDGMFIPCRNFQGEINSLYIRRDNMSGHKKYVHFSAGSAQGVQLNFVPHSPLTKFVSDDLFLTEGVPKGDVACEWVKANFLCLPGVGMWRNFSSLLEEQQFKRICVAFDSDLEKNETVACAVVSLTRSLIKKDENVSIVIWDIKFKGIDDAVVGGADLIFLNIEESKLYLESVFHRLGKGKIDWEGDDDITLKSETWGQVLPLPEERFDLPEISDDMVPEKIKDWAFDLRDRMQAPLEYILITFIAFYSSILGRKLAIRPKGKDNWVVVPNLWALIIGPPSSMKSPIFQAVKKVLDEINLELFEEYQALVITWRALELSLTSQIKGCQEDIRKRQKEDPSHSDILTIQGRIRALQEELELTRPKRRQVIINDSTIEKVQEDLSSNPNGLAVCRDEMSGFFHSLEKTGRENDRSFYLESFNGNSSYRVSRIQRGDFIIPANCLSLIGGIQPGPLHRYFFNASESGSIDDGMIQRFLLMVYPNSSTNFEYVDREPNREAEDNAMGIIKKCFSLEIPAEEGEDMAYVRYSPEAQVLFRDWLISLERKLRSGGFPNPPLESHFGKYKKLVPALSLIFHTIEGIDDVNRLTSEVSEKHLQMAISWASLLEKHAMKVYEGGFTAALVLAHQLYEKIKKYEVHQGMGIRDIYRKGWKDLKTKNEILLAIEILEEHNIARVKTVQQEKGAPSLVIEINPDAIPLKRKTTDKSDTSIIGSSVSSLGGIQ